MDGRKRSRVKTEREEREGEERNKKRKVNQEEAKNLYEMMASKILLINWLFFTHLSYLYIRSKINDMKKFDLKKYDLKKYDLKKYDFMATPIERTFFLLYFLIGTAIITLSSMHFLSFDSPFVIKVKVNQVRNVRILINRRMISFPIKKIFHR